MNGNRGYDIDLRADGTLAAGLHHVAPDNAVEIVTRSPVMKPGTWQHLTLTWDGSSRAAGIGLFVDGFRPPARTVIDHLRRSIVHDGRKNWDGGKTPMRFGRRGDERLDGVTVDELRVWNPPTSRGWKRRRSPASTIRSAPCCVIPAATQSPEQQAALREHYLLRVNPAAAATRRALAGVPRRREPRCCSRRWSR